MVRVFFLFVVVLLSSCKDVPLSVQQSSGSSPGTGGGSGAVDGVALFEQRCSFCHSTDGSDGAAPTLKGLFNSQVQLSDGTTLTADDGYIRESITNPGAKVVQGYRPMRNISGLSDSDVTALVNYIKSLK